MVLRATWPEDTVTAAAFLRLLRQRRHHFTDVESARIEELKQSGQPPEDKWFER